MIKVKNEKQFLEILRAISSEAVSVSKRLNENTDPGVTEYLKQFRKDEEKYGSLDEVEDAEEDEEKELPADEIPDRDKIEDTESRSPEEVEPTKSSVGASFDSVVAAVNNLRSGRSLRDTAIKQQAQNYYDRLSEDERSTLLIFLNAISDIISGQISGSDAQDPSDPPASIKIMSSKDAKDEEPPPEDKAPPAEDEVVDSPEEDSTSSEEDTSPPIKVNESQDLSDLRRKVRRMMLRG